MTDRNSPQDKAKYIYAYLTKNGCSPTCAVAVMCNLYRDAEDGIVFPINRLDIDYDGNGGVCVGGGLRAWIYVYAINMCNKYGVGDEAKRQLTNMNKFAKSCRVQPLSAASRSVMAKQFPGGFPVPIDVQLRNILDTVKKNLRNMMNNPNATGPEIAYAFHKKNNSNRKRGMGKEWAEHAADICRLLGLNIKQLNNGTKRNMKKESLIREFRENYFNLYGRMQRLNETAGGMDQEEEEFTDNEFNYDRMDDMERDWMDWEDNREDGYDGIDFLDDDEDTTRTGLHRRSGRDDDHLNRPFKRYEDENMNIFDDPAGMASEDDYQHFHHPDGYLSMLAQDPSERGDVAREFKGTRGSEGDGMRRAHRWPVDED